MADTDLPYLLFYLGDDLYAISTQVVRELILTPRITGLPEAGADIRGVINLRGKVIKVVDLRRRLGMNPLIDEIRSIEEILELRKQDHIDWLNELENSIREKRDFKFTTNPHECRFGKWYYGFKSNNDVLTKCLPRLEEPHSAIHLTAKEALAELKKGNPDKAIEIIDKKRSTALAEMIHLLDNFMRLLTETNSEITIVLSSNGKGHAITVDRVLSVERIPAEYLQDPPEIFTGSRAVLKIGRRKSGELITVLDSTNILT
jgi:purine-binding chemotaxis protein CheW